MWNWFTPCSARRALRHLQPRAITTYGSSTPAGASPRRCSPLKLWSPGRDGSPANAESFGSTISAGGRYVAFVSSATNLVPSLPDTGGFRVYVRDMCIGASSGCTPKPRRLLFRAKYGRRRSLHQCRWRYIGFGLALHTCIRGY